VRTLGIELADEGVEAFLLLQAGRLARAGKLIKQGAFAAVHGSARARKLSGIVI
jgi:hypothetical protein